MSSVFRCGALSIFPFLSLSNEVAVSVARHVAQCAIHQRLARWWSEGVPPAAHQLLYFTRPGPARAPWCPAGLMNPRVPVGAARSPARLVDRPYFSSPVRQRRVPRFRLAARNIPSARSPALTPASASLCMRSQSKQGLSFTSCAGKGPMRSAFSRLRVTLRRHQSRDRSLPVAPFLEVVRYGSPWNISSRAEVWLEPIRLAEFMRISPRFLESG